MLRQIFVYKKTSALVDHCEIHFMNGISFRKLALILKPTKEMKFKVNKISSN